MKGGQACPDGLPDEESDGDFELFQLLRSTACYARRTLFRSSRPSILLGVLLCYSLVLYIGGSSTLKGGWRRSADSASGPIRGRRSGAKGQVKLIPKSEAEASLLTEFNRRRKQVQDTCEAYGAYTTKEKLLALLSQSPSPPHHEGLETREQLWALLKKTSHHQFFVQKEAGLLWCKVPKAASTSWLFAYLKMAGVPEHEIPRDNGMGLHGLLRDKYPMLAKNLNKQYMPTSLKFMVVRHPFERIISAYLDKLSNYNRDLKFRGGYYYAMYGGDIVAKYRETYLTKYPRNKILLRKEPSFIEFVHYIIETPITEYDEHWRPQFLLCPPCFFKFDIIVKMETFQRDTQFILSQKDLAGVVNLDQKHAFHANQGENTQNMKIKLFSQLSQNMVRALYEKYKIDFKMFDYSMDDYIRLAKVSTDFLPDVLDDLPANQTQPAGGSEDGTRDYDAEEMTTTIQN